MYGHPMNGDDMLLPLSGMVEARRHSMCEIQENVPLHLLDSRMDALYYFYESGVLGAQRNSRIANHGKMDLRTFLRHECPRSPTCQVRGIEDEVLHRMHGFPEHTEIPALHFQEAGILEPTTMTDAINRTSIRTFGRGENVWAPDEW